MFELLFGSCLKGNQCFAKLTSKSRCFQKNCRQMYHIYLHDQFIKKKAGDDVAEQNAKASISQSWKEQNCFTQSVPVKLTWAKRKLAQYMHYLKMKVKLRK